MTGVTALVLAGSRAGAPDPMAAAAGLAHKALLPVAGVPMLLRVLRALRETPGIGRIAVCAQQASAMLATIGAAGDVLAREAAAGPSQSVAAMLAEFGTPLLVTTADHALLTPAMLSHLLAHAPHGADVVAGVARADIVRAACPDTRRTWLRFRDGAFSGCNMFLLRAAPAGNAVRAWQLLERDRKRPLAMARLLGPATMVLYGLRLLTLRATLRRLEGRVGATLGAVVLPFGEAAIDIDKPHDLALAEARLMHRARIDARLGARLDARLDDD
jgi:GTP:adenosylcobinamide-phosphate guanylyltransferase